MNIGAVVFARYNSARLPGKVLYELGGDTIVGIITKKLESIAGLEVVVATSDRKSDDPIANWCKNNKVECFRGDLENVALRTEQCLESRDWNYFFRVNADSPFLQIELLKKAILIVQDDPSIDLVTNVFKRSYPYGIAVELVSCKTFLESIEAFNNVHCEHITMYFYQNDEKFNMVTLSNDKDLTAHKFVLDTKEDWERLQALYKTANNLFNLDLPQLISITEK